MRLLIAIAALTVVACDPPPESRSAGLTRRRSEYEETRKACLDRGGVPIVAHDYYGFEEFVKVTHCDFPPTLPALRGER